uniref:Ubiquinone biosynthesis monooxygenase COQ6, mitochondrial n=1 Tax=Lygus hesperus TaxID=30085 RepID=A0A0A9VSH8_LYGHE
MFCNSLARFSTHTPKTYDVVISGGGMIGSTMALALGKNPFFKDCRIALVEANPKEVAPRSLHNDGYSNRVSAINPSTKDLFDELGVWKRFHRFQAVHDMKVWGVYTDDTINYRDESGYKKNIAYIVENDSIVASVTQELKVLDNVDIIYGAKINTIDLRSSPSRIILNNGEVFHSNLLIGADGANSEVRKVMNVQNISYTYDQTAVVATLKILEQENSTAWQRFLPTGPIALLPLNNCFSSLVWSTSHENAKNLLSLPSASFVDAVNDAFNSKPIQDDSVTSLTNILRTVLEPSKLQNEMPHVCGVVETSRASFPLGFGHASNYVKPNIALIGDAAHKVHPLAGQGVNLGFRDVHHLTAALQNGVQCGRQIGDYSDLKTYEQKSQCSNLPIMLAIDMIYRVYSSQVGLIRALGSVGIQLTEGLTPIKNIMRRVASS